MDYEAGMLIVLEGMLHNQDVEPMDLPISLLKLITKDFSDSLWIGRGGFAEVYKGLLGNGGRVAVKKLLNTMINMDDTKYKKEVSFLLRMKHKNIVRLLGYCADTREKMAIHEGKTVPALVQQRLLCFEYLGNGSLHDFIKDASCGLEWRERYQIIKGICEGLLYIHEQGIAHLDLKPANILLDDNMVPKISDFGLSRFFDKNKSKDIITSKLYGTAGYVAPEFFNGDYSPKSDIYSLGVIFTELLTGQKGYFAVGDVLESWKQRLGISLTDRILVQIRSCVEISTGCIDPDPKKRPSIDRIIQLLAETETEFSKPGMGTSPAHITCSRRLHMITGPRAPYIPGLFLAVLKIDTVLADETAKAVVAKLFPKGGSKLRGLEGKIQQVRDQLTVMMAKIAVSDLTNEVNGWIREVRKLVNNVEDLMDKYMYYCFQREKENIVKKYFTEPKYITDFSEIADEIAMIQNKIKQVTRLKHQCLLIPQRVPEMGTQWSQVNSSEHVKDEDLVGIEDNKRVLTRWLYSDEADSTVITVLGMGGLGKTTLVSNVYDCEKSNFSAHMWMVVSQSYTMDALLRKLLWEVGDMKHLTTHINDMALYDLNEKIKESLKHRKLLLVLDDVWDQDVYFKLSYVFAMEESRIIITTRKNDVAALAPPQRRLELQPLSKHHAFDLFCRTAFCNKDQECPKELIEVANSIIDRCYGFPVAIVSIGRLLSLEPHIHHFWNQIHNRLESELSNDDNVKDIFNQSYHDLSVDLKNCVLYCSLFPEDYLICRESLVRMWIAEGFVLSSENKTLEEVAEENFMNLINCNLLVIVHNDEQGKVSTCRMHRIVRDLACVVAKQERFGSANDYSTTMQLDKDVRRLSYYGCWKENTTRKVKHPHLRTLVSLGTVSFSTDMLSSILSDSIYLTVLELQDSEVTELPASIGHLFNLRYIGLRHTKINSLPDSIENLSNLLTLDVKGTKIQKLPRGIGKVKKLRHLMADRCADGNLAVFPDIFGAHEPNALSNLSEFPYHFGVETPNDLLNFGELQTLETVEASKDLAAQLKKLMQLRSVWIDNLSAADCENIFATLSNMPCLSSLLLSARDKNDALCLNALRPISTELYKFIIIGQWAEGALECPIFRVHGAFLKYLAISWCDLREDPLDMLAPYLLKLTYLRLSHMRSAKTLVLSAGSFPHLKMLVLKHMPAVNEMVISDGALPCIEALWIVSLARLDKVPQGMESLRSLKKLWVLNLPRNFRIQWDKNRMFQKMQHVLEIHI